MTKILSHMKINLVKIVIPCICFFVLACSSPKKVPDIRSGMRDAAVQVAQLFSLMWQPEEFEDRKNFHKIEKGLKTLYGDFHGIEKVAQANPRLLDPGFAATIEIQKEVLADTLRRFQEGNKDYAAWRLRGLAENCMTCHTRQHVSLEYFGQQKELEVNSKDSFESQLAAADFLVASRQFSKGADRLFNLAEDARDNSDFYGRDDVFQALAHWLIVEVRSLKDYKTAAAKLSKWGMANPEERIDSQIITTWLYELENLSEDEYSATVAYSEDLLEPALKENSYEGDQVNLVRTLRASAILHEMLMKPLEENERRAATFSLAVAYMHLPLPVFDSWKEIYLVKTIRLFPGSDEAKQAFSIYRKWFKQLHTGSSGLNLEKEDHQKLAELKAIAFSN